MAVERDDPSLWAIICDGRIIRVFSGDALGYACAKSEAAGNMKLRKVSLFEVSEALTEYAQLLDRLEDERGRREEDEEEDA
jgi:hypothetical protein